MKKFLTLVLALVMALAIAVPAMAFVNYDYEADSDYEFDFYLVDYDESYDIFTTSGYFVSLPEADRGYVTNEVVGAVFTVFVPEDDKGDNLKVTISGDNVRFWEAPVANRDAAKLTDISSYKWAPNPSSSKLTLSDSALFKNIDADDDLDAAWLIFGKVLDDDASLTVKVQSNANNDDLKVPAGAGWSVSSTTGTTATFKIGDVKYVVNLFEIGDEYVYEIMPQDGDYKNALSMYLFTDDDFDSYAMLVWDRTTGNGLGESGDIYYIDDDGDVLVALADNAGTYAKYAWANLQKADKPYKGAAVAKATAAFISDFVEEMEAEMGIDPELVGNRLKPEYLGQYKVGTIYEETLEIVPWQAYVSIPDVEVIDPPKTGDAATLVGFVMILAALAGVVVFKKVRA